MSSGAYTEEVRKTVIGLARDLRGLAFAFNTKTSYMMLFDWIYPAYTPILQTAVELWFSDPQAVLADPKHALAFLLLPNLN
jgi:hypothetical protein